MVASGCEVVRYSMRDSELAEEFWPEFRCRMKFIMARGRGSLYGWVEPRERERRRCLLYGVFGCGSLRKEMILKSHFKV